MSTSKIINLAKNINEQLPEDIVYFIKMVGTAAEAHQQRLYLVGGVVRDLLLERVNIDIDMVVEGDAIKLAQSIAEPLYANLTIHTRFGTAKFKWAARSADFATARAESYARPGALPMVKPGTISDDLARRDFTINAMAIELNPRHFGDLIDPFGGRQDLKKKLIRVLHEKSFIDDATRIWRAIRYEQRLDFHIESITLLLIKRDVANLKTISGDRIRHELELVLKEELPEKVLHRADEIDLLQKLHPALKGDEWLAERYEKARELCLPDVPRPELFLSLLCYRLIPADLEHFIKYLRLSKATAQILKDTLAIKNKARELEAPSLAPSAVYELLHGYHLIAYTANAIATDSPIATEYIELYLDVLRHVNPVLSGEDLKKLGVPRGPRIKEVLQKLREARLDGLIDSKKGEEEMVRGWGRKK
jgi:tRNA nucleotidyltransferase (CCA-adding enzyme)